MSCWSGLSGRCVQALVILGAGSRLYGLDQSTEERCREAARALLEGVKGQEVSPPGWQGAAVSTVERVPAYQQERYICQMVRGDAKAGYVMLVERGGQMKAVMFSGSAPSREFATTVSLRSDRVLPATPRKLQNAPEVFMNAPIPEDPRSPRKVTQATTSPMACCLASVLLSLQTTNESVPPLFANMQEDEYWRRLKPFLGPKADAAATRWETRHGFLPDAASNLRYRRHREALVQALRDAGLIAEPQSHPSPGASLYADLAPEVQSKLLRESPPSGCNPKDRVKAFEVLSPLVQQHLVGRITPNERFLGIKDEQQDAQPGWIGLSQGMRIACLLEQGYVRGGEPPEGVIARFARTRGFAVDATYKPVSQVLASELPCLLVGPNKQAAVLMALSEDGPGWGLLYLPETVQLLRKTASGWAPYTAPARPATLPATASIDDRIKALVLNTDLVMAPDGRAPQSLERGAHMVAMECLDGRWKAIPLTKWKALDNWELGEPE